MDLGYKVRQLAEKIIPLTIVGALAYGGWTLYKKGTFRYGLKPALTQAVSDIPYFGSRFRHYIGSSNGSSYVASKSKHSRKHGKRHHGRRHRRHR